MALMCVACRTENRDAAKFCKGCGGKLVSLPARSAAEEEALEDAWGATLHASLVDESGRSAARARGPSHRASRPSALLSAAAEPASQPQRIDTARQQLPATGDRSVRWVMLAALAIIVATGGAYVYRAFHPRTGPTAPQAEGPVATPAAPVPTPPAAAAAPAPEPAVAAPAADAPTPAAPAVTATEEPVAAPSPPASSSAAPPAASTAAATPRKPPPRRVPAASAPVAAPPVVTAPVAPAAPEPAPVAPPAPADPSQACAGRNFIATAQCLAAQCVKAEFTAHARCDAVRRQQQIEEEKRNPVNAG